MVDIRVVIADDHPVYRDGLKKGLNSLSQIMVVGEAKNGQEAVDLVQLTEPDILLLDMEMPEVNGLDAARRLRETNSPTKILPLSSYSEPEYVFGVLELGAEGYLMKDEPLDNIADAIELVLTGGVYISPRVSLEIVSAKKNVYDRKKEERDAIDSLIHLGVTPSMLEVLLLAARGYSNEQIAEKIYRSIHTVRNHLTKVKNQVGVNYRPALVAWAWRNGVLSVDPDEYKDRYR